MSNKNSISYRRVGDYNIPNLTLPPEEANITLGKWGMLHKDYLLKNEKAFFTTLLTQGELYQYCAKVENQAVEMFELLIEQMKQAEGVTEQFKSDNQMEWLVRMNNIRSRATEIVNHDIVFV